MTHEVTKVEIVGLEDGQENDGRNKRAEKWRIDIDLPEFAWLKNDGLENDGQVDHGI